MPADGDIDSLARLLQLWYFLPFVGSLISVVEADQLLISWVGLFVLLVTVVVERVLLRGHIFANVLLIVVA